MVVTFYSFKGGVGRSMAMVNVAEILASRGYRVIVADWDLEAPGLERYLVSRDIGADEYRRQLDAFLTRDGIIDLLRDYKASLTRPARLDRATPTDFAQLGKLLVRRPSAIALAIPGEGRSDDALRLLPAGRRDGEWQDKYGETVRSFDWDEFYERWAGDAYVDFFRRDLAGDRTTGVTGAGDLLLIDSRTGVTEQGGVCTHDLADLVLLFSAANVTNLEGTRWMAKALAQPRLIDARGGRPIQVMPIAARIEQTSQKEELVDFRARFLQALREFVPSSLGSADAFALETEIPYMPFYAFNERVVAREPAARREQKLYMAYENIADAIVRLGSAAGLLDERIGATKMRRTRTRMARVEPPKEPIILTHEDVDGATAERLATALQSAGAKVAARFHWNRVQRVPQFDRMLATCEGLIALVGARGITPLLSGDLAAARRQGVVNPRFRSAVVLTPDAPAASMEAWSGPSIPYPTDGEPSDDLVQDILAMLTSPAALGWEEALSPYLGLRPFVEEDARFFFGRDAAVNEIIGLAESVGLRARWISISGFAGVGKSSLAFAGVVPAIRRGLLTGSTDPIRVAIFRPGLDPIASLCSALTPLDVPDDRSRRQLLESLQTDENTVARLIRGSNNPRPVVLVLDQLDQLFAADRTKAEQIGRLLGVALDDTSVPLYVISTARSEQIAALEQFPLFRHAQPSVQYTLDPLDEKAVADIISGPAAVAGITFEPGLLERIVADAMSFRTAPGMITLLMQTLWNRRSGRTITHDAYNREGGFGGVLVKHANRMFEGYAGKPEHEQLRRLMLNLTTSSGVRASLSRQEALYVAAGPIPAERILEAATGVSLVAPTQGRVTLIHDALLEPGSVIRQWHDAEGAALKVRDELEAAANAWEAAGRPDSGLPAGALLERLATAAASSVRATEFLAAARSFQTRVAEESDALAMERRSRAEDVERDSSLRKEREAEQRRSASRATRVARLSQAAVFVLLIGSAGAIYWGSLAHRDARLARADATAIEASSLLTDRPDRALALAVTAAEQAQTDNTIATLRRTLAASRERTRFPHSGDVVRATFDGTGRRVLTLGRDGRANVWDLASPGKPLRTIAGATSEYLDGDLAQDGRLLALALRDGTARVWSVDSGGEPVVLRADSGRIGYVRFSQDGSTVLTSASRESATRRAALNGDLILLAGLAPSEKGGPVNVWDAKTGQLRQAFSTRGVPEAIALSADGSVLVTAGGPDATLWNVASGQVLREMNLPVPAEGFTALSLSRDANRILCAVGSTVILWDRKPSWGLTKIDARSHINAATFDPTATRLITGNSDGSAEVVVLADAGARRPLLGHAGAVLNVAFSPDGTQVATASQDGTARLWDANAERDPVILRGHDGAVTDVAFSPDGKLLLTKADDNSARLWDVMPASSLEKLSFAELLAEARKRAPSANGERRRD